MGIIEETQGNQNLNYDITGWMYEGGREKREKKRRPTKGVVCQWLKLKYDHDCLLAGYER